MSTSIPRAKYTAVVCATYLDFQNFCDRPEVRARLRSTYLAEVYEGTLTHVFVRVTRPEDALAYTFDHRVLFTPPKDAARVLAAVAMHLRQPGEHT